MLKEIDSTTKHVFDVAAIGTAAASFWELLPGIAALLSIIWVGMRIIEGLYAFYRWMRKS